MSRPGGGASGRGEEGRPGRGPRRFFPERSLPSSVRAARRVLQRGRERVRHRGDLHRRLEPGPPDPAALRSPGRGSSCPYQFGSAG